jgi:hypothetical protein
VGISLTTGSNNIDIANKGVAVESGTIRTGTASQPTAAYLFGVYGSTVSGQPVVADPSGKLRTQPPTAMLNHSTVVDHLRARLGNVRTALQARLGKVRTRLRTKVQDLRQRTQALAGQIQQIRDRRQGIDG